MTNCPSEDLQAFSEEGMFDTRDRHTQNWRLSSPSVKVIPCREIPGSSFARTSYGSKGSLRHRQCNDNLLLNLSTSSSLYLKSWSQKLISLQHVSFLHLGLCHPAWISASRQTRVFRFSYREAAISEHVHLAGKRQGSSHQGLHMKM